MESLKEFLESFFKIKLEIYPETLKYYIIKIFFMLGKKIKIKDIEKFLSENPNFLLSNPKS